jgi:UDP-N-acetylglucosamine 2-epimerase
LVLLLNCDQMPDRTHPPALPVLSRCGELGTVADGVGRSHIENNRYNVIRNEFSGAVMSVDELLKSVDNLSDPELESLVNRALFVRAHRRGPIATPEESTLLRAINRVIPAELSDRYVILADKRDEETLTEAEYQELLAIAEQIEAFGVKRLEALVKLSELRQVPLLQLMADLGIKAPEIR